MTNLCGMSRISGHSFEGELRKKWTFISEHALLILHKFPFCCLPARISDRTSQTIFGRAAAVGGAAAPSTGGGGGGGEHVMVKGVDITLLHTHTHLRRPHTTMESKVKAPPGIHITDANNNSCSHNVNLLLGHAQKGQVNRKRARQISFFCYSNKGERREI